MKTWSITRYFSTAWLALIALVGCDAGTGHIMHSVEINNAGVIEFAVPEVLRTIAAIAPDSLQPVVKVNNTPTTMEQTPSGVWTGSVNVPSSSVATIDVQWGISYGESGYLMLVQQPYTWFPGNEPTVNIGSRYNTDFDADDDGRTNLTELKQSRSPIHLLDVDISPNGAYVPGGSYVPGSESLPPSSVCGTKIPIAVKTVLPESEVPGTPANDHQAWWCAKLKNELIGGDGNVLLIDNLELTVHVVDDQLFTDNDPQDSHHDDSIEIFIDGANSKGVSYDVVDDYHFRILPLTEIGAFEMERGLVMPEHLQGRFEFLNGGYILTATIPLYQVGIKLGQAFGLNVEVIDRDTFALPGELVQRDGKFSWVGSLGKDISWRNPSAFGTAQVHD